MNLARLKRAYIAIAKEMILYQPYHNKTISLDPFDWLAVQNLIGDYFKSKGIKNINEITEECE